MRIAIPLILGLLLLVSCVSAATIPIANFRASTTTVCTYEVIQFTDVSTYTGTPSAWFWLFGDSQDSHLQNPTHFYDTAGTYSVSLRVWDEWGDDTVIKNDYIVVTDCHNANFTVNKSCVIGSPAIVTLNGTCEGVELGKSSWHISPNQTWTYWNGISWIPDFDGVFNGDDTGEYNAVLNITSYGSYNVTRTCNFGVEGGIITETKTNAIIVGVPGTSCSGGCSSGLPQRSSLWMVVAFALVMITAMFVWVLKR